MKPFKFQQLRENLQTGKQGFNSKMNYFSFQIIDFTLYKNCFATRAGNE